MYCLKCGREIPEGNLFCTDCAAQPDVRNTQYFTAQPDISAPRPSAPTPVRHDLPEPQPEPQRRMNMLLIPLIAVAVLFIGACILCLSMYRSMTVQRNNFRVKEADLALRESEISGLRQGYDDLKDDLEQANGTISAQKAEIASLKDALHDKDSSASQERYDVEAAQKNIQLLTDEKNALLDENEQLNDDLSDLQEALEEQIETVKEVQDELDEMSKKYKSAKEKSDFMDTYIVFVNNNGSNLYHTFDCHSFTKSNFWAYSRKLAENYGYSPCPDCCG